MDDLISVIVPVYKTQKYLDQCVQSIVNQTYSKLEIILVDDGSPDDCPQMCDEWAKRDSRIKIIHKENGGLSSARNAGLEICQGRYVGFVDSDDWIDSGMYRNLYKILQRYPQCQIAECDYLLTSNREKKNKIRREEKITLLNKNAMFQYFFRVNGEKSNDGVWKYLIDRTILSNFKFINTLNEDVEASFELFSRASNLVRTNRQYYYYFTNKKGITSSKFSKGDLDYFKVMDRIVKKTKNTCPQYLNYAEFYRIRANFTMLAKMKIRGYDKNNSELNYIYHCLKENVRKNRGILLKGKMPMSRKILLLYLCL